MHKQNKGGTCVLLWFWGTLGLKYGSVVVRVLKCLYIMHPFDCKGAVMKLSRYECSALTNRIMKCYLRWISRCADPGSDSDAGAAPDEADPEAVVTRDVIMLD